MRDISNKDCRSRPSHEWARNIPQAPATCHNYNFIAGRRSANIFSLMIRRIYVLLSIASPPGTVAGRRLIASELLMDTTPQTFSYHSLLASDKEVSELFLTVFPWNLDKLLIESKSTLRILFWSNIHYIVRLNGVFWKYRFFICTNITYLPTRYSIILSFWCSFYITDSFLLENYFY